MTNIEDKNLKIAVEKLLQWSKENHHQLPWRKKRSLYGTLVSEIMLQQTTVGTVLNHYEKFLKRFPTIEALAKASHEELAIEWKGLGYYRRAKNLKNCAEEVTNNYAGVIPDKREHLISIKGIGDYTADALIAIGNNKRALAIDANLERVIARLYTIDEIKGTKLQKKIREDFSNGEIFNLKDFNSWRELNEALMDLGRVYCKSKAAFCDNCPMGNFCKAHFQKSMLSFPVLDKNKETKFFELDLLRIILKDKGKVLVYKKNNSEWLSEQWEVPTLIIRSADKKLKQYPHINDKFKNINLHDLKNVKTSITKYKIKNYLLEVDSLKDVEKLGFTRDMKMQKINENSNFSTTTFKLLRLLENKK